MAMIFIPVSRLATSREPRVGVSPPWNRSQFSSTRSAPPRWASITSSALPQHTSSRILPMFPSPFCYVLDIIYFPPPAVNRGLSYGEEPGKIALKRRRFYALCIRPGRLRAPDGLVHPGPVRPVSALGAVRHPRPGGVGAQRGAHSQRGLRPPHGPVQPQAL